MASKPMFPKHRARLIAVGLLALLALTLFIHTVRVSDINSHKSGGSGAYAQEDRGLYVFHPDMDGGDRFRIKWEWVAGGFRPIFSTYDFYVVDGAVDGSFDPSTAKILFHARDTSPGSCCEHEALEMVVPYDADDLRLVWDLDYADGWEPVGDGGGGMLVGDTTGNAQQRELAYIEQFLEAAGGDGQRGAFSRIDISYAETAPTHTWFLALEILLGLACLVLFGLSLKDDPEPEMTGETGRLVALVERGRSYLRGELRLHLVVGPLLLMAGAFGAEAIDNGAFSGGYDPTGFFHWWIPISLTALWLLAVGLWLGGLVRVVKALRHYNKTQEPDLGGVGA